MMSINLPRYSVYLQMNIIYISYLIAIIIIPKLQGIPYPTIHEYIQIHYDGVIRLM